MKVRFLDLKQIYPDWEFRNIDLDQNFSQVNHDTRQLNFGEFYLPIVGEIHDGHKFIDQALQKGAIASFCERSKLDLITISNPSLIVVDDTDEAIALLARYIRRCSGLKIAGITGTTGKTTTRGMLTSIFQQQYSTLVTPGSINTLWGNIQTLISKEDEQVWAAEVAMDRSGEITWQCNAIEPDIGVILNIGTTHAELLGGAEKVYEAKTEMARYLEQDQKTIVLNISDLGSARAAKEYKDRLPIITFGYEDSADWQILESRLESSGTKFTLRNKGIDREVNLGVFGVEYAENATAAIILALELGVEWQNIIEGIGKFKGAKGRFQKIDIGNYVHVIHDAYNANPKSMHLSINTFASLYGTSDNTYLFLGDMRELGEVSEAEHQKLGEFVKELKLKNVFYTGHNFEFFGTGQLLSLDDVSSKLAEVVEKAGKSKAPVYLLFKASLGIGIGKELEEFLQNN